MRLTASPTTGHRAEQEGRDMLAGRQANLSDGAARYLVSMWSIDTMTPTLAALGEGHNVSSRGVIAELESLRMGMNQVDTGLIALLLWAYREQYH
jgi:hypothetical protein